MTDVPIHRRTLYIGKDLNAMLDNGSVSGTNPSERVNRLSARYAAMVQELVPQRWSVADWMAIIIALKELSVAQPFDALVLGVRLKQMAKQKYSGADVGSLAYRVDNLRLPELLAVVDVAERANAAGVIDLPALSGWLLENQVVVL